MSSIFILACSISTSQAQQRCATTEHTQALYQKFNRNPKAGNFEQWISQQRTLQQQSTEGKQRKQAANYRIPIVVHIIHNGEPIGVGRNISDEQVYSQIKVLNQDFKRLNNDASATPLEFQSLAGSLDVEFVLAKQDPSGNASNGIIRKQGSKSAYNIDDDALLKSESFWPSEDYLNIWVCDLIDYLGYAQFPVSDLDGLEDYVNEIAATDGIVVTYDAFGSIDDGNFLLQTKFNKGRTLTHEAGHFFGLRHIWGDNSNCASTTDYVDDTPQQNIETTNCPSHPQSSCSNTKMFQNYMDYTNDACMNLFSQGQADRMQIVLENSIRRLSLLSSPGLITPPGGAQNVALRDIISPTPVSCSNTTALTLRLQNLGSDPLEFVKLLYTIDDGNTLTQNFTFSPVAQFDYTEVSLNIAIPNGEHSLATTLDLPNNATDINLSDNSLNKRIIINAFAEAMPARERFDGSFVDRWSIVSPTSPSKWETTNTFYNQSIAFEAVDLQQMETSWLVSPIFDLSALNNPSLRFDWSYRSSNNPVSLQLKYTTDCGLTYQNLNGFTLFQSTTNLTPTKESDWESTVIDLSSLAGNNEVRIAWVASAYLGNPVYIDNIEFYVGPASLKIPIAERIAIYPSSQDGITVIFNTLERQDVSLAVYDLTGKTIIKGIEPQILNQTYTYQLQNLQTGLYIVRIKADNQYYSQKVFIEGR